ncbi:MAG: molybdate ABC transporter substrate-binding protein [Rhodocyclaceae bacterium]|nr:molybdate ABC transporter substrate-binding protein [Rhodocyclaceae bacterium]MBK6555560.1 molybdate ABC transporter substrate-binding protein [Rhodocyclaceae bacterium]MBK9312590.1 molybdate ABC transporter substrate-binding protein [Rhodocyclaceae bacterium]MBK9955757.1 molybdate ABC transporter substrate-binding protein [Rhodocyclaceae bacterium]
MDAAVRVAPSRNTSVELRFAFSLAVLVLSASAQADEVQAAVAANFTAPMRQIAPVFEQATGHKVVASFGGTGKFYAQIKNGAPFEILLSADDETPTKLAREGAAVAASQFTYAKGKLALWSAKDAIVDDKGEVLKQAGFDHIALANPKLAPYGAAAVEAMKALGVHDSLAPKFVTAENIGQTFQFVKSGNALLGFVALSQVTRDNKLTEGSAWVLPANLYQPIKQDAIVLDKGKGKPAAEALMKFLRGDQARAVIRAYGYDL